MNDKQLKLNLLSQNQCSSLWQSINRVKRYCCVIGILPLSVYAQEYSVTNVEKFINSTINDTIISPAIVQAPSSDNTIVIATSNILTLKGSFSIPEQAQLYGGLFEGSRYDATQSDLFTGNTLNIDMSERKVPLKVNTIANFQTINIKAAEVAPGDTIIDISSTGAMKFGQDTSVYLQSVGSKNLKAGDTFTLINGVDNGAYGVNWLGNDGVESLVSAGESVAIEYLTQINYDLGDVDEDLHSSNGSVKAEILQVRVNEKTKAFNVSRVGSLAFINAGDDLITQELTHVKGKHVFGTISGSHSHYRGQSTVDVNGVHFIVGALQSFEQENDELTTGVFFEAGSGNVSTKGETVDLAVRSDGDAHYYGVGLLGKYAFSTGVYADGALRFGRVDDDFQSSEIVSASGRRASHDGNNLYYGLQAAFGYRRNYSGFGADFYTRYFYNHIQSDTRTINTDRYHFSSINSSRVRVGMRVEAQQNERFQPYVGLAFEHEFDAKSSANVLGYKLKDADISGSSMLIQAGMNASLDNKNLWHLQTGITTYCGQRQGVSGDIRLDYRF